MDTERRAPSHGYCDECSDAMVRIAWFHCFAGISGDMALGSLIDAGADIAAVREALVTLPFEGWTLEAERVTRAGVSATRAVITVTDDRVERTAADIVR